MQVPAWQAAEWEETRIAAWRETWPVAKVTGAHNARVSLAALIAIKPGRRARLIYRVHRRHPRSRDRRQGFTQTGYARPLGAHQQLGGPLVVGWDTTSTPTSAAPWPS